MLFAQTDGRGLFLKKRKIFPISLHFNQTFPQQKFATTFSPRQAITEVSVLKPDTSLSLSVHAVWQEEEGYVIWHGGPGS